MKEISKSQLSGAITDFLTNFPFFSGLSEEELEKVAEHIEFFEMDPHEILFKEGDAGDSVYFIIDGEMDVIKESLSASGVGIDKVVLSTLSKGRSIGEMSLIDNIPRSATIKAQKHTRMVKLSREGFDLILDAYPRIGNKILKGIARLLSLNLRKTSSRLADYMLPMT